MSTASASSSQPRELDLQDMVDELVREHTHREPYIIRNGLGAGLGFIAHHQTKVPALIDQLLEPEPGSGELSGSAPQSRPAARVEGLDTIALIAEEAGEWLNLLGVAIPAPVIAAGRPRLATLRGSDAKRVLISLRAQHAGLPAELCCDRERGQMFEVDSKDSLLGWLDFGSRGARDRCPWPTRRAWCCVSHHIEADVRYWWRQARIIAGWDSPPWRPYNTCPNCSKRRGLRINSMAHTAVCVECRTVWEPSTIGLLAEHIRAENGSDEAADEDEPEDETQDPSD